MKTGNVTHYTYEQIIKPSGLGRSVRLIYHKEKEQKDGDWIHLAHNRVQWQLFVNTVMSH